MDAVQRHRTGVLVEFYEVAVAEPSMLNCYQNMPLFLSRISSFPISLKPGILKMIYGYSSVSWVITCSLILLLLTPHASADCFYPNGTSRNGNITGAAAPYKPCFSGVSMCCSTVFDTCERDGLCSDGTNLWRESCTDPTWQSPNCVKLCVSGLGME